MVNRDAEALRSGARLAFAATRRLCGAERVWGSRRRGGFAERSASGVRREAEALRSGARLALAATRRLCGAERGLRRAPLRKASASRLTKFLKRAIPDRILPPIF